MKRWTWAMILVLAVAAIASACGSKSEPAKDGAGQAASGETKAFTIDAKNFEFDLKEIRVKKGDTVQITLKNSQGNHAVKIEGYNKEVQGGKTITFVADKAGEFKYICSIFCGEGHGDMVGKLVVEA